LEWFVLRLGLEADFDCVEGVFDELSDDAGDLMGKSVHSWRIDLRSTYGTERNISKRLSRLAHGDPCYLRRRIIFFDQWHWIRVGIHESRGGRRGGDLSKGLPESMLSIWHIVGEH